jgi:hypothetical protein
MPAAMVPVPWNMMETLPNLLEQKWVTPGFVAPAPVIFDPSDIKETFPRLHKMSTDDVRPSGCSSCSSGAIGHRCDCI